jgi:hypothetical protein
MANVLVRDLDDDVLKQLKAAAKAHGRSLRSYFHTHARIRNVMRPLTLCLTLLGLVAATAGLRAETHRFVPKVFYNTFSGAHPRALRIKSGGFPSRGLEGWLP